MPIVYLYRGIKDCVMVPLPISSHLPTQESVMSCWELEINPGGSIYTTDLAHTTNQDLSPHLESTSLLISHVTLMSFLTSQSLVSSSVRR